MAEEAKGTDNTVTVLLSFMAGIVLGTGAAMIYAAKLEKKDANSYDEEALFI